MDPAQDPLVDILIVDDEEDLRSVLKETLELEGYSVTTAEDAVQAEEILEKGTVPLILCDISMPLKSGLELVTSLRKKGHVSAFVMISAHSDSERLVQAIQLGAIDYIIKPFNIEDILKKVPIWLEVGKRTKALGKDHGVRMIELLRLKKPVG